VRAWLLALALAACAKESRTAPPPEHRAPDAPAAATVPDAGASACVAECVRASQMEAVSPEQIEADCRRDCAP
jgi:hypothetical protein